MKQQGKSNVSEDKSEDNEVTKAEFACACFPFPKAQTLSRQTPGLSNNVSTTNALKMLIWKLIGCDGQTEWLGVKAVRFLFCYRGKCENHNCQTDGMRKNQPI